MFSIKSKQLKMLFILENKEDSQNLWKTKKKIDLKYYFYLFIIIIKYLILI
jgi:hypothetical protein